MKKIFIFTLTLFLVAGWSLCAQAQVAGMRIQKIKTIKTEQVGTKAVKAKNRISLKVATPAKSIRTSTKPEKAAVAKVAPVRVKGLAVSTKTTLGNRGMVRAERIKTIGSSRINVIPMQKIR